VIDNDGELDTLELSLIELVVVVVVETTGPQSLNSSGTGGCLLDQELKNIAIPCSV